MGMSNRDIQIALMAALQESGLRNLDYGDRDSLGLFQQRPSAGWGTPQQIRDPYYASKKFFSALGNVRNRNGLELWQAAQKVQVSAFPRAYAKWESSAQNLMGKIGGASLTVPANAGIPDPVMPNLGAFQVGVADTPVAGQQQTARPSLQASPVDNPMVSAMDKILKDNIGQSAAGAPEALGTSAADEPIDWSRWQPQDALMADARGVQGGPTDLPVPGESTASGIRDAVLNLAKKYIGTPYVWGGTSPGGFDCSGFTQYALKQMGISVPRLAYQQANYGTQTSIRNIRPGDLVFWGNSHNSQGNHIAFYLGNGQILEAPRPGLSVRVRKLGGWDKDAGAIGIKLNY